LFVRFGKSFSAEKFWRTTDSCFVGISGNLKASPEKLPSGLHTTAISGDRDSGKSFFSLNPIFRLLALDSLRDILVGGTQQPKLSHDPALAVKTFGLRF